MFTPLTVATELPALSTPKAGSVTVPTEFTVWSKEYSQEATCKSTPPEV